MTEQIMTIASDIFKASLDLYLDVAIYMLFGFFVAGVLHAFFKPDRIRKTLGTGRIRPVVLSALFGIPIPLCSCGVVPVATSLKKQGANSGAALSFMIATPESGVDSIAVSWAMLDPIMTVIRPVAGFFTAIATGVAQNFIGKESPALPTMPLQGCGYGCSSQTCGESQIQSTGSAKISPPVFQRLFEGLRYAYGELLADIARPFAVGILIAGIITFLFPDDLTLWSNAHPFLSMLVMLAAGIPMYVCATSSTPIAAALILKGLNPGAALVFLLAGPATNAATMTIVKSIFNTRALVIYLSMIAACSLGMGMAVDWIYRIMAVNPQAVVGQAGEIIPFGVQVVSAVILTALIAYNGICALRRREHAHDHGHAHSH